VKVDDRIKAIEQVRKGSLAGFLEIPTGFSQQTHGRGSGPIAAGRE
jgi:hypothetical protein